MRTDGWKRSRSYRTFGMWTVERDTGTQSKAGHRKVTSVADTAMARRADGPKFDLMRWTETALIQLKKK